MKNEDFDVALIDADSLIYTTAWFCPNKHIARRTFRTHIERIIEDLEAKDIYVFVKGKGNFRTDIDINYKAHRSKTSDPEMQERVALLTEWAQGEFITSDGAEADDYCFIYANKALEEGLKPVVCHIDKDLNMIPGFHYNYKTKDTYITTLEDSFLAMHLQLLTGDAADNIQGLWGIGPGRAKIILDNKKMSDLKDKVLTYWRDSYERPKAQYKDKYKGRDWEEDFYRAANLLILRDKHEELRELTPEEIRAKMTWDYPEDDMYAQGRTENVAVIENGVSWNAPRRVAGAIIGEELTRSISDCQMATGAAEMDENTLVQKITTDLSTVSPSSLQEKDILAKRVFTNIEEQKESGKATGKRTRAARKKSTG